MTEQASQDGERWQAADPDLLGWLANGERGISSDTIVQHLTGIKTLGNWGKDIPYDPADLRRCRLLLERVPALRERFPAMASCSAAWERFVERWDELCALFDAECPDWRDGKGEAQQTYELMTRLRDLRRARRKA